MIRIFFSVSHFPDESPRRSSVQSVKFFSSDWIGFEATAAQQIEKWDASSNICIAFVAQLNAFLMNFASNTRWNFARYSLGSYRFLSLGKYR